MPKHVAPTTGQLIRAARLATHQTQTDLAERIGSTQEHVSRVESGAGEPTLGLLSRIATALGVDRRDLIGG